MNRKGDIKMIGICTKCGNHQWDKEVKGDEIHCPKCGNSWKFIKLPLFILTGCSGIGKTTTAMEIIRRKAEFTVLDGDMFYNIMPHETEEDYYDQVEQIGSLSKNLMQTGLPVLWTMAGNLDKLPKTYNSRFFREIYCLALVCEEELLRARMRDGRGIKTPFFRLFITVNPSPAANNSSSFAVVIPIPPNTARQFLPF